MLEDQGALMASERDVGGPGRYNVLLGDQMIKRSILGHPVEQWARRRINAAEQAALPMEDKPLGVNI